MAITSDTNRLSNLLFLSLMQAVVGWPSNKSLFPVFSFLADRAYRQFINDCHGFLPGSTDAFPFPYPVEPVSDNRILFESVSALVSSGLLLDVLFRPIRWRVKKSSNLDRHRRKGTQGPLERNSRLISYVL